MICLLCDFKILLTVFNQSYNCQTSHYLGRNWLPKPFLLLPSLRRALGHATMPERYTDALDFSSGESSEELAIKLFADLSKKLIQQLYELYKIDFEMFDYDYKKFTLKWINQKIKTWLLSHIYFY